MNDDREFQAEQDGGDDEDRVSLTWLAPLQRVEPSLEARLANRTSVAAELARLQMANPRSSLPWWRRTVVIPVPAVMGLAALIIIGLSLSFNPLDRVGSIVRNVGDEDIPRREAVDVARTQRPGTMREMAALPRLEYYETRTYLCGVGFIASESGYETQE